MENEWVIKLWPTMGVLAIHHFPQYCSDPNTFTYGLAFEEVCHICKKPIPEYIKLQWKLLDSI